MSFRLSLFFILSALAISVAGSPQARAQDVATADALFNQAKEAMVRGDYKTACPAFRQSYTIDPVPGALYALATCHADAGEIATAVVYFESYLKVLDGLPSGQKAKHQERAATASSRLAMLRLQVPELTLVLPASAPSNTRVTRDDIEQSGAAIGVPLPIDPGEHTVTTQVPGGPLTVTRFTIRAKERRRLELSVEAPQAPMILPEVAPGGRSEPVARESGPVAERKPSPAPSGGGPSTRRVAAYVVGGLSLGGFAVGAVAGALVFVKKGVVEDACVTALGTTPEGKKRVGCTPEGWAALESGRSLELAATLGVGVGLSGVAVGLPLYFTEPKNGAGKWGGSWIQPTLSGVGLGGATAGFRGVW